MNYFLIPLMIYLVICNSVVLAKSPNKLFGGTQTALTHFPFHVSIYYNNHIICSGSIITSRHILTAASCVYLEKDNMITALGNLEVLTGSNDEDKSRGVREFYNVDTVMRHVSYKPHRFWRNDIAILLLEKIITFSLTRSIIPLPFSASGYKVKITLVNWGKVLSSTNEDKSLQFIQFNRQSNEECRKIFPDFLFDFKTQSCAKTILPNSGITMGDGGAALVYANKIVGIVSAFELDQPQFVIYTKVYPFMNFINTIFSSY